MKLLHQATLFATILLSKNQNQKMHTTWDINKSYLFCSLNRAKTFDNMKSACNKSCRSSHKDSRTVEFAFFDFSTNIYRFYKFAIFGNKKKNKTDSRIYTPWKFWGLANRSLPDLTGEGRTLGAEIRRGRSPAARGK